MHGSYTQRLIILLLFMLAPLASQAETEKRTDKPAMAVQSFPLHQVRLTDGRLMDCLKTNRKYLDQLSPDLLLAPYRKNAGLEAKSEMPRGWEPSIPGTMLGHYTTALALMYAQTGDETLKERGAYIVSELAEVQQALGGEYLAGFPESVLDSLETGRPPFVVYYVIHKYLAGLLDQYTLCGNQQALDVLEGMVAYLRRRVANLTDKEMGEMLDRTEEGGMSDTLWSLYEVTGKPEHKALAQKFEKRSFLDGLAEGHDNLTGRHGNTHIPLAIGAARHYEVTGEEAYRFMTEFFWHRVVDARSFATGGSTTAEHWRKPYELAETLTDDNHETCKTYNMLKVTRHMFQWTGDPLLADYYERAFMNGILGTQEPESGMLEYYVPQASGYQRIFGSPFDSFWCCYGTGIESYSKLSDSIYFHDDEALYVNLFFGSRVQWPEKGLTLEQTTDFPREEATHLTIEAKRPAEMALMLRVPYWTTQGVRVTVNGKALKAAAKPGSYLRIERTWKDGDRIDMEMPMSLHAWPMPDDPQRVTVMYGPLVLAGIVNEADEDAAAFFSSFNLPKQPRAEQNKHAWYFLADSANDLSWLKPVAGKPLTFRTGQTEGQPFAMTFMPFNRVVGQRYGLNWRVVPEGSDRQKALDMENEALDYLREMRAIGEASQVDSAQLAGLRAKYEHLDGNPALSDYQREMALEMGRIENLTGHPERGQSLVESMTLPFIRKEDAEAVWAVIGRPEPVEQGVTPLLMGYEGGDGSQVKTAREGRACMATDLDNQKSHVYFSLPDHSPLKGLGQDVEITFDYYDAGTVGTKLLVEYDSKDRDVGGNGPAFSATETVIKTGEKGWHTVTLACPSALFINRQNYGSDFRISSFGDDDECIAGVTLSIAPHVIEAREKAEEARRERIVDEVIPGNEANEAAHGVKFKNSNCGPWLGTAYRHAPDGWFSWQLKVLPEEPMALCCTYWGSDAGRVFDVLIDGEKLLTQELNAPKANQFVKVETAIPAEWTRGKESVTVMFKAEPGDIAGGVFGCATLKAE